MREWLPWDDGTASTGCDCDHSTDGGRLQVDASACADDGDLLAAPACRAGVVDAIGDGTVDRIVVTVGGMEVAYLDEAGVLLAAAARFSSRVVVHDERLARVARRDPLSAAATARDRADPVRSIAVEAGLLEATAGIESYESCLRPAIGPAIADARIRTAPPRDVRLVDQRRLPTDAVVRLFDRPDDLSLYHLEPAESRFDADALRALDRAASLLESGAVCGDGAARTAARRVLDDPGTIRAVGAVLEKHTADLGVLVDCFADPAVTDLFATPPIPETPLRVVVDGTLVETNVWLSERGARALASTLRLQSGRPFSRSNPLLDATATAGDRSLRVAGTTDPVSTGLSFAFRAHERNPWTLDRLVENGTVPPRAAALLSLAVERDAAILVAGARGAGKTTLLGALLFELPRDVRTLLIEDTPELPIEALRDDGRDVQTLHTETGDGPGLAPSSVLRGALRLGEGALAVGEVRGEEATVLYEAMRVGASDGAVLGTIHGEGGRSVRERVVSDLDVPASSFATTDLVVTVAARPVERNGDRTEGPEERRRVVAIEEVIDGADGVRFASLFDADGATAGETDRLTRGTSRFLDDLALSGESYAEVHARLEDRTKRWADGPVQAPGNGAKIEGITDRC